MKGLLTKFDFQLTEEKKRFLLFGVLLFGTLFFAFFLLRVAYSRYEVHSQIYSNIDKALYIFKGEDLNFNLDPDGIVPRNETYTYRFSVSNFDDSNDSDVDLTYSVSIRTTTNLPISVQLYRNELPTAQGATNILSAVRQVQDADNTWYRVYDVPGEYTMLYENRITDVYTMVISFPAVYKTDLVYADYIENIEVSLKSKQMV